MTLDYAPTPVLREVDILAEISEIQMPTEYTEESLLEYDKKCVAAVSKIWPEFNWLSAEPSHDVILVDREGFFWTYDDSDPYMDNEGNGWRRHRHTMFGKFTATPCPEEEWSEVVAYGPMREFDSERDGRPIHKFIHWPDGYKDGSGVGTPVVLTSPFIEEQE